jgi:hypothetical protein
MMVNHIHWRGRDYESGIDKQQRVGEKQEPGRDAGLSRFVLSFD